MFIAIFISILLIYALLVYYIGRSSWTYIKPNGTKHFKRLKWVYIVVIAFLSTSFILGRLGEGVVFLQIVGAYWMMIFSLLLMLFPIIHLSLWILRLTKLPRHQVQRGAGIVLLTVLITAVTLGSFNAYSPVVPTYEIGMKNSALAGTQYRIVMAADMHFGLLSGKGHAQQLVSQINALQPDLVLFPGDIIDDDIQIFLDKGIDNILTGIQAKHGVYASLGNHDKYRGAMADLIAKLEQSNMTVLYDDVVTIDEAITIIGRKDKTERNRADLSELLVNTDPESTLILLEHQPYDLDVAANLGIDLMLSGHTHHGQIFPANYITNMIFENDYGYLLKDDMHSIVTSGFGFWGPPIRIGSRSEVVEIIVSFHH